MKYFGTDGIRGIINEEINENLLHKLAKAIVQFFKINNIKNELLVGNDSRISSSYILSTLCSILLRNGINIHNVGVCSSPCLAYITKKFNYPLSLMISASHNTSEYNGIKFFNNQGEKVNDEFELTLENLMDSDTLLNNNEFTTIINVENLKKSYINYLNKLKKFSLRCILDCSNGGTSYLAKKIFTNQEIVNCNPNGKNINEKSGCTNIDILQKICKKKKKLGFAFDGDGDRIFVVDEFGEIYNGDKILYILSNFYLNHNDCLVGTIYTNSTLEKLLKFKNINLIRANVGDKNVYNEMLKSNSILGGEESGHIILKPFTNTGDGMLNAIIILNILELTNKKLKDFLIEYNEEFQIRENLHLSDKEIKKLDLEKLNKMFSSLDTKIIVRKSGTEPVLRLFVESKNFLTAKKTITKLKEHILNLIK